MGRDIDRKGHIRSGGGGGVPVDALYAVMAAVGGNRLDHAGSAILRAECALGPRVARSKDDDAADALAFVHQVEALVDLFQRQHMGDHRVDLDLAVHVPVDDLGYVGRSEEHTSELQSLMRIAYAVFCLK